MDCPNCGKPLRHVNPNYCSRCGYKLKTISNRGTTDIRDNINTSTNSTGGTGGNINTGTNGTRGTRGTGGVFTPRKRTLEFSLTLIGFIISIFSIFLVLINYSYYNNSTLLFALFSSIIGVFGAIIIRYYPKIGAIFSIAAGFLFVIAGAPLTLIVLLFYIISAILCYARK